MKHDIVPVHLAVKAMRDNGYKNAAYALAELMDNAIQASASKVELLCGEKEIFLEQRRRFRIEQIAVLDNGKGMNKDVLRMSLQFGNGLYLDEKQWTGIGRFGMGLPASSISQCKRVDVWTWQNGIESAIKSYLDLDLITNNKMTEVPEPKPGKVPDVWRKIGSSFGKTGTLVVWSNIDRCIWRTAAAVIDNSEFVIGRMYRKFLEKGKVNIRLVGFDIAHPSEMSGINKNAMPNDPGYLMAKTSCPAPYDDKAMFQKWGDEDYEVTLVLNFRGKKHDVRIRFSYAKEEARKVPRDAGHALYGKHAGKNVGVSLVRSGRELDLDQSWVIQHDTRERWWGVEVDFPPALDELFGVTNNKQSAHNFSEIGKLDIDSLLQGGKTITQVKSELEQEEDPRASLIEITHRISKSLGILRRLIEAQAKGERSGRKRHEGGPTAESEATAKTKERQMEGHKGLSDEGENLPAGERKGIIEQTLIDEGVSSEVARELAGTTISNGLKYVFAEADLETPAFFSVKQRGGTIVITLNTSHPAYPRLVDLLEKETETPRAEDYPERLGKALDGLKLLLMAWARYEDEQPDGILRTRSQESRIDWGRIARQFLENED